MKRTTAATSAGVGEPPGGDRGLVGLLRCSSGSAAVMSVSMKPGRDDVGGDAAAAELAGDRARQADQAGLARGVVGLSRRRRRARRRCEMSTIRPRRSRIIPLLARRAQRKAPARLVSMTVSQSSSLIRISRRVLGDAGVGDEHLDRAAELLLGLGEGGVDGCRVGDVAADAHQAVGRVARAVGDRDVVAGLGEGPGDGQADAAVAAGDEDGAWLAHAVEPSGLPLGSRSRATSRDIQWTGVHDPSPPRRPVGDERARGAHRGPGPTAQAVPHHDGHPHGAASSCSWSSTRGTGWIFAAGAVFLPFIAVVAANAVMPRVTGRVRPVLPVVDETPQITRGPDEPHESDGSATDR